MEKKSWKEKLTELADCFAAHNHYCTEGFVPEGKKHLGYNSAKCSCACLFLSL